MEILHICGKFYMSLLEEFEIYKVTKNATSDLLNAHSILILYMINSLSEKDIWSILIEL